MCFQSSYTFNKKAHHNEDNQTALHETQLPFGAAH
jgi:hypothetical protein